MAIRKTARSSQRKRYYQVRDVVSITGVNDSTLRNWETRYSELKGVKRINGRRHYTESDIEVIRRISYLRNRSDAIREISESTEQQADLLASDSKPLTAAKESNAVTSQHQTELKELVNDLRKLQRTLRGLIKRLG